MKLEPDQEMRLWVQKFLAVPENFDWDAGNSNKSLKHGFSKEDIESIFLRAEIVFAGRIIVPMHSEWRGLILGMDRNERFSSLIFTRREDQLRPISCRPMRKKEATFYNEKTKT